MKFKIPNLDNIRACFSIDLRTLALFRVSLALLLLLDLWIRFADLTAFYTDDGVLPRSEMVTKFQSAGHWSIHLAGGSVGFQSLIFLIAAIFAVLVLIGWHTKLSTVLSWILLVSLQNRAEMLLQGGDTLFRCLLFWSMFLPLGARFSIDHAIAGNRSTGNRTVFGVNTVTVLLQLCIVYWFTAALKSSPDWWGDGSAVYFALQLDLFLKPIGKFVSQFAEVLRFATWGTMFFEFFGPLVALFGTYFWRVRVLTVFAFIGFHLSLSLCMMLGLFSFIASAGWLLFLPTQFWDWLRYKFLGSKHQNSITLFYDGKCGFCRKSVFILSSFIDNGKWKIQPAQISPIAKVKMEESNSWIVQHDDVYYSEFEAFRVLINQSWLWPIGPFLAFSWVRKIGLLKYRFFANHRYWLSALTRPLSVTTETLNLGIIEKFLVLGFALLALSWNIWTYNTSNFKYPTWARTLISYVRLEQKWDMFAPRPMRADGWFVFEGELRGGKKIDIFDYEFTSGKELSFEKPENVVEQFKNYRWGKYLRRLKSGNKKNHRLYFGKFICRRWNYGRKYSELLDSFNIYFMKEVSLPNYQTANVEKISLWRHWCFKKPNSEK